ncbi:hypothetical protein [Parasitella parasitica]|uniref:Uncharacterized protein n=1 Tax=Parasitella parasitica TaxID=35722 RepID=A0A0B7NRM7_9FUNG|nr:hypothetical protein [Parasitella parasitica]
MFSAPLICPATCELCGYWMPKHQDDCPRNGIHPSQWTMDNADPTNCQEWYNDASQERSLLSHTNALPTINHEKD